MAAADNYAEAVVSVLRAHLPGSVPDFTASIIVRSLQRYAAGEPAPGWLEVCVDMGSRNWRLVADRSGPGRVELRCYHHPRPQPEDEALAARVNAALAALPGPEGTTRG